MHGITHSCNRVSHTRMCCCSPLGLTLSTGNCKKVNAQLHASAWAFLHTHKLSLSLRVSFDMGLDGRFHLFSYHWQHSPIILHSASMWLPRCLHAAEIAQCVHDTEPLCAASLATSQNHIAWLWMGWSEGGCSRCSQHAGTRTATAGASQVQQCSVHDWKIRCCAFDRLGDMQPWFAWWRASRLKAVLTA